MPPRGQLPLFPDLLGGQEVDAHAKTNGVRRRRAAHAVPEAAAARPPEEPQSGVPYQAVTSVDLAALTVAELEAKIAVLEAAIAPLAKQRSEFLRKKRNLVAVGEASKARSARAISPAKVKALALKHGKTVKAVEQIARELHCTSRTVYRKLKEG